jgi:hypothetical protein
MEKKWFHDLEKCVGQHEFGLETLFLGSEEWALTTFLGKFLVETSQII